MPQNTNANQAPLPFRERVSDWLIRAQSYVYGALVFVLLLLGFIWPRMFFVIPPGHLGVIYRTLNGGTDTKHTLGEDLHIIPPWDRLTLYDVRLQQQTLEFKVLSDEGLTLGVQVVVRFRPYEGMLGYLQKEIGSDYFTRLIKPEIESHVRRVFGNRPAHELWATVREVLQELSQTELPGHIEKTDKGLVSRAYVQIQDVKLVIIELPKIVEDAIAEKYHQEQLMLAYRYRLERELKEADRKRTEAAGIRDFNQIAGKSADIMHWRGLEVASEFAKSPNAKFVILGSGQGTLPMILNLGDSAGSMPPGAAEKNPQPAPALAPRKTAPASKGRAATDDTTARSDRQQEEVETLPAAHARPSDSGGSPPANKQTNAMDHPMPATGSPILLEHGGTMASILEQRRP